MLKTITSPIRAIFKWVLDMFVQVMLTEYRFIPVIFFVLPASKLFYWWESVTEAYRFATGRSPQEHDQRVKKLQEELKSTVDIKGPMCTNRPSWQQTSILEAVYKKKFRKVDLSKFTDILEVNTEKRTVRVEPLVRCGQLSGTLLKLGWTTEIVPELDDLTVGGLICGFGVESTSFKVGLFQHICVSYDVVLPDGRFLHCSATENPEMFYNIPWSHGTLGFLVAAEIRIMPAKKYVLLNYQPCYTQEEYIKVMEKHSRERKVDFIETLAFNRDEAVVMTGTLTDNREAGRFNEISRFYKPWFYQHVKTFLKNGPGAETIPLRDYYHRHTKGIFWEMEAILPFGNHPLFRYTLGWLVPPKVNLLKLTTPEPLHQVYLNQHVDQDFLVPYQKLGETIDVYHKNFEMYPLWLCPCRIPKTPIRGIVNSDYLEDDDLYIDIGAYGTARAPDYDPVNSLRRVEKYARSVNGFQTLYAVCYQTEEEFNEMYDFEEYNKLRKQYGLEEHLPVVYDKVSTKWRR